MNFDQQLNSFGAVPFTHGSLLPLLAAYRRPNEKIAYMLAKGDIVQLRRGLYVLGAARRGNPISLPLVANLLHGPSCVSLDFALSWHGLIPEGVIEVSSVTPRRAHAYATPLGKFSYTHLPLALYCIGVQTMQNPDRSSFLIAGPEKALCDKVALTRNHAVFGVAGMQAFLLEDLRVDADALQAMDKTIIGECIASGYKQRQLTLLYKVIEAVQCR
jgi:hypothetical protein